MGKLDQHILIVCIFLVLFFCFLQSVQAIGNPSGDLHIEINTAYNLVVDSNVESPSTYAPEAFYIGAKICNDGTNDLTNVVAYVGNFDEVGSNHTPGIYPERTHLALVGTFSLTHEGPLSDATRKIDVLAGGECVMQYWLVSYPRLDDAGNAVHGPSVKTDDDLWLQYDVWATGVDSGVALTANQTTTVTLRNEISAMANKIWPNGDNKVPAVYLAAIQDVLGWDSFTGSGSDVAYPGDTLITEGVWYDLGNVGQGFDNNGDFVPDQNAWIQPVGDPALLDSTCFRLVHVFGIIIVKLKSGGELLIPFEDQLYFENIPDNTGTVGLVYYEFGVLNGPCVASLTPYQEVASGYDNEKFNGDYGHYMPQLVSYGSPVVLDKQVDKVQIGSTLPDTLSYTLAFTNTGDLPAGNLLYDLPLMIEDSVPTGTTYVAGSAAYNIAGGTVAAKIYYSTDDGASWATTEPVVPSTVTTIQWWLEDVLAPGATGTVGFEVIVPSGYSNTAVSNTGVMSMGSGEPFADDTVYTLLRGSNSIGNFVWQDEDNSGTDNGGTEAGINGVGVTLYWDQNGNGELDDTDILLATQNTVNGSYLFTNLPSGNFIVAVDGEDPDLPDGYKATTDEVIAVMGLTGAYLNADFGFGPPLTLNKTAVTNPIYEGREVVYHIDVTNNRPSGLGAPCTVDLWASATASQTDSQWVNPTNAVGIGGPNATYATSDFRGGSETIAGTTFVPGIQTADIVSVEALFSLYINGAIGNDIVTTQLYFNNDTTPIASQVFTSATLNPFGPTSSAQGLLTWDLSNVRTWDWSDFSGNLDLAIVTDKINADDNVIMHLDAIGFRVTTKEVCGGQLANMLGVVPLTDTYNANLLEFVSAVPDISSLTFTNTPYANTGVLHWANVGLIDGQETKTIEVTFMALEPTGNLNTSVTNGTVITDAAFLDGSLANDASSSATGTLIATGSLAGTVWSEGAGGSSGWINAITGYENGIDHFIPGVTVYLYGCVNGSGVPLLPTAVNVNKTCIANGGTWQQLDTQITDTNGDYLFDSLLNGFYYVSVDPATIPGTEVPTAEAGSSATSQNGTGRTCGTCDNQWGTTGINLNSTNYNPINSPSEDIININFGYSVPPAISGTVWQDFDGDGGHETGETGFTSGTVTLTGSDSSSRTVNIDSDGTYEFVNLTPGVTYTVTVNSGTLPASGSLTETAETDGSINNQIVLTPVAGEILSGNDFGFHQVGTSSIGHTLFYDWDGDGIQDSGDQGIANVTIELYADVNNNGIYDPGIDPLVDSVVTLSNGFYEFTNLAPGNYVVVVDEGDGDMPLALPTADPDEAGVCTSCNGEGAVTLPAATSMDTIDFGYQPSGKGSIGDTVWYDQNGDGSQFGTGEKGLADITVQLWVDPDGDGNYIMALTTTTDANGHYLFENLPDGNYRVVLDPNDPTVSNNNYFVSTADAYTVTLSGGEVTTLNGTGCVDCNNDADFGLALLGAIGDTVFWDANGNGESDYGDRGIAGVTVTLTNSSVITDTDGVVWPIGTYVYTTTTSDGSDGNPVGFYLFDGLVPGAYDVSVDSGSSPIGGAAQTADPDRDGVTCDDNTYPSMPACDDATTVTILPGSNFMGADFGYQPSGVIGDYVWFDQNGDGIQQETEIGLSDLVVTITNGTDTFITTTDYNGEYVFSNLPDGSWTITIEQPSGMAATSGAESLGTTSTTAVLSGGVVTSIGGVACTNCDLNLDLGFQLDGDYTLTGAICLEDSATTSNIGGCDAGDTPVAGHTVYLYNDAGDYLGSAVTAADGSYTFSNLVEDTYYIAVGSAQIPLQNTVLTTTNGNTPANSSNPGSPITAVTTLSPTSNYQTVVVNATTAGPDNTLTDVDFAYEPTVTYDFGDLPNSYNATELGDNGPRHILLETPTLYLGSVPTSEVNGKPGVNATNDTDDGVSTTVTSWVEGSGGGSVTVDIVGNGYLVGWFDFNGDGDFLDAGEMIISEVVTSGPDQVITFDVPDGLCSGDCSTSVLSFYARFRLFAEKPLLDTFAYTGVATNGEVEDYLFGSAPTSVAMASISVQTVTLFPWTLLVVMMFLLFLTATVPK